MSEQSELLKHLQQLLRSKRSASFATLTNQGEPFVSMVPFAIDTQHAHFVIHISEFAAHTRYLLQRPTASLMLCTSEEEDKPVHDLSRVTFQVNAIAQERGTTSWAYYRDVYLNRFPDVEFMTHFKDFNFFALEITRIRQVAGFGAAKTLDVSEVQSLIKTL
ncbi:MULTISPECIES: HugZ family protein [Oligella]|uniref:Pyridoxamine 5'-phosphate oxidase n=3 Tax=Oligella urethralis TaxID=90245 RepID=A0A095Z7J3_9BURK|nr:MULTISPECIES: pyridoxamine 5'-phosphate oxidase family protein [Oligella]AVL71477.1 pyridoxamine 5'-phosphate oxidase [Oligella urethralis]KGF30276.1 pyridoxamine 5'-phosphate oxidase [Oligella urethralis DNF00040]OFS88810.1 pyridoxamine 5'-phosphate oxidase [Oligella sp. HMSC05A10]OFV48465.1 pyridoxamine 5'-phosphate oxidase [Oligella sp. HMSC09E12]SPY07154.1 heme utilization protein HutZ [Oligella urethralis]